MKKLGIAVIAAALLLSGCAAGTTSEPAPTVTVTAPAEEPAAVEPSTPAEALVPTADPGPLTAATPEKVAISEEQFLNEVRLRVKNLAGATDEQLLAAGKKACELYAAGQTKTDMRLIEGEVPIEPSGWYQDSLVLAIWGAKTYCVEFDES